MTVLEYTLLFIGGILAGIINSLAGNGSAITLTVLMAVGLDANMANATNRIGVLAQTLTSVLSLKKTPRTKKLVFESIWFYWPTLIGSVIGAYFAIGIDKEILKICIGVFMIILLITMLLKPKKWLINTDNNTPKKTILNFLLFLAIGLYGGFIQMGIGIMILSTLVLIAQYSLKDANIIKLLVAFVMIVPAFFIFLLSGDMLWIPGLTLAVGATIGAHFGTRYVLYHPKANQYIRYLLIAIITVALVQIYGPYLWR